MSTHFAISERDSRRTAEVMEAARYSGLVDDIVHCGDELCISMGSLRVRVPVELAETVLERALIIRMEEQL